MSLKRWLLLASFRTETQDHSIRGDSVIIRGERSQQMLFDFQSWIQRHVLMTSSRPV